MANQPTPHAADPSAGGVFQAFSAGEVHGCWCLRKYWWSVPDCYIFLRRPGRAPLMQHTAHGGDGLTSLTVFSRACRCASECCRCRSGFVTLCSATERY